MNVDHDYLPFENTMYFSLVISRGIVFSFEKKKSFRFNHEKFAFVARHLDFVLWKLLNTAHRFLPSISMHIE